jgi:hypothetical protein
MPGRIQKLVQLDAPARALLVQAYWLLCRMRFLLATRTFKSLVSGLQANREPCEQEFSSGTLAAARQIGWAVETAARYTPWESSCLVQVLAAQRLLARNRISGTFYLGALLKEADQSNRTIDAHAWLQCGDEFITGEAGHERFTVMTSFSW